MTPEYASTADVTRARDLGIDLVVDLRGPRYATSGVLGEAPGRRIAPGPKRPIVRGKEAITAYSQLSPAEALPIVLKRMGSTFAEATKAIADALNRPEEGSTSRKNRRRTYGTPSLKSGRREGGGVLVHCRLGKDRTGVFTGLMLRLLGVSEDEVIEDYLLSAVELDAAKELLGRYETPEFNAMARGSRVADELPNRAAMEEVLTSLERDFGGAEGYLRRHRISGRTIDRLIDSLLE
jgi:hypothetical protein